MVDLVAVAQEVAGEFAPASAKARVHIRLEAPDVAPVAVDAMLIREILSNLIDNAIRYNRRDGHVVVRVEARAAAIVLAVEDDGPGVAAKDRERIFQRFYRLPRDQGRTGSGLGLSIVQALALRLGASITATDGIDGRGLRISVAFGSPD